MFLVILAGGGFIIWIVLSWLSNAIEKIYVLLKTIATTFDAVVIVAMITGMVSIIGVIISSVVAKFIEYRKNRQDYLAKKREQPYGEFVEMVYKIQQNVKKKTAIRNNK